VGWSNSLSAVAPPRGGGGGGGGGAAPNAFQSVVLDSSCALTCTPDPTEVMGKNINLDGNTVFFIIF
jgi:hypothetical protein